MGPVSSLLAGPWSLLVGDASCSGSAGSLTCSTISLSRLAARLALLRLAGCCSRLVFAAFTAQHCLSGLPP